jgi:ArsR family transcriptional regulator
LLRLQILDILRRSPECVCHLQAMLHKPQPYISQQLRVLREAGVIADTKDGLNVYYHLIDPKTASYLDTAFEPAQTVAGGEREPVAGCLSNRARREQQFQI